MTENLNCFNGIVDHFQDIRNSEYLVKTVTQKDWFFFDYVKHLKKELLNNFKIIVFKIFTWNCNIIDCTTVFYKASQWCTISIFSVQGKRVGLVSANLILDTAITISTPDANILTGKNNKIDTLNFDESLIFRLRPGHCANDPSCLKKYKFVCIDKLLNVEFQKLFTMT